jgi:hypothetical protein
MFQLETELFAQLQPFAAVGNGDIECRRIAIHGLGSLCAAPAPAGAPGKRTKAGKAAEEVHLDALFCLVLQTLRADQPLASPLVAKVN